MKTHLTHSTFSTVWVPLWWLCITGSPLCRAQQLSTPSPQPASYLAWEADSKTFDAKPGESIARFTIYVTNVSAEVVVITNLQRTCGCTEATMPAQPWRLEPGICGPIQATIDLRGKAGKISKPLTVQSSAGSKVLMLNVNIPPAPPAAAKLDPLTPGLPAAKMVG